MAKYNPLMQFGNAMMIRLLQSRWHRLLSSSTMLVTFTGRKSGKRFTTPVNYLQDGETLYTLSSRHRTWWRNLRGGAEISLRLRGEEMPATGEVVEDDAGVAAQLSVYLAKRPDYARFLGVSFDAGGQLNRAEAGQSARNRVMVIFQLKQEERLHLKIIS